MGRIKRNLYAGIFINYLLFSATTPMVNIFFIQKVSAFVFSVVNWVSIIITLLISKFLKDKNNRDLLEKFFIEIIIIDTIMFMLVSMFCQKHINIRFFGLAILNGTTTAMWVCVIRCNINRIFTGEILTDFNTHQDYIVSVAELIGASIAILFTRLNIDINLLMVLQVAASATMGYFDYKAVKLIKVFNS